MTEDDLKEQQKDLEMKEMPAKVNQHEKMKEKLKALKPEDKATVDTSALLDANFIKIAKRSKVWLMAIKEQETLRAREKNVERSYELAGQFMSKDYLRSIKQQYRAPHIMGDQEIGDFLEVLAEAIYQSVGKKRVKLFELDEIFPLYPPSRMHFDYSSMVSNKPFDALLDELANQKAISLSIRLVSENIVKKLSTLADVDEDA